MVRPSRLEPAPLAFDAAGTPVSSHYGDIYHAAAGGLAQARHVFLGGNDLPARWRGRDRFAILETGFGTGLNFLATWQAWRADPARPRRLHYFSVERHPFTAEALVRLHAPYPEIAALSAQLVAAWPSLLPGFHRLHFEDDGIALTLVFAAAPAALTHIGGRFDGFYLDGFAPARNPEMWSDALIEELAWLAAPGATLATWCVAGEVRRRLAAADFAVTKRPGFAAKREMTRADFRGAPRLPVPAQSPPRAAVIGAGIAGCACAERLAKRGWEVALFERQPAAALETSGNRQAVLLPVLAVDETRLARLHRVAFLYALRRLAVLADAGLSVIWQACGVLQLARDAAHARKQQSIVADQQPPADFVQWLDAAAAGQHAGCAVPCGGWWFPRGGWLSPRTLCEALLAHAGDRLTAHFATPIAALEPVTDGWQLRAVDGRPVWTGPTVILANAHDIAARTPATVLPLRCFRGQATHLPAAPLADLPHCVICREGYLAPAHDGLASLGATFQRSHDPALSTADHAANLARLAGMLPVYADRFDATQLSGRVGLRPVSPDQLPLVGALPRECCTPRPAAHVEWPRWPGLHLASGYGSRGFVWAPLMAELLASQLAGEPLPVETELAAAVDPARFAWKGMR